MRLQEEGRQGKYGAWARSGMDNEEHGSNVGGSVGGRSSWKSEGCNEMMHGNMITIGSIYEMKRG